MQNEMTLCAILVGVMAFFMILGMVGIRKEKKEMQAQAGAVKENTEE